MKTQKMEYQDGKIILEGYYAYNDNLPAKKPAVLIVHDWSGRNDFACKTAEKLAELGYLGFALDIYGKEKLGKTREENMALMSPFMNDRKLLQKRILAGLDAVKKLEQVDTKKIAAIGFCFGGLCVLDLARSGADICGVVSFHGLLGAPQHADHHPIRAKILAIQGHDDPMVSPEQLTAFQKEMTVAHADWQLHIYGNAMHAFTNPLANDPDFGTVYHPTADRRSWIAMQQFFTEIFA